VFQDLSARETNKKIENFESIIDDLIAVTFTIIGRIKITF